MKQNFNKPKIIQFNNPGDHSLHFHDDQALRNTKISITQMDIAQQRKDAVNLYKNNANRAKELYCKNVKRKQIDNINYLYIEPKSLNKDLNKKIGLFFFGGGFITGTPESDLIITAPLANELGCHILSNEYRLAPEHPFPAGLNDCVKFYKHVVNEYGAENIFLIGESAGANLALATVLVAQHEGIELPKIVVALSPATDQCGNAYSPDFLFQDDPCLSPELFEYVQRVYSPDTNCQDPRVSPHYADFGQWFPRILFTTGSKDIFQNQVMKTAEKMSRSGIDVTVHLWEAMWHVFEYTPEIEESKKSIQHIAEFIRSNINS